MHVKIIRKKSLLTMLSNWVRCPFTVIKLAQDTVFTERVEDDDLAIGFGIKKRDSLERRGADDGRADTVTIDA